MNSIYDYENNITITTTPNGDKVITMNSAIFTEMLNAISDGQIWQKEQKYLATAEQTNKLWNVLYDYDSVAEMMEEWEDYTPAEPLIKDEKIRKAVRAWAEANSIDDIVCYVTENGFEFAGNATRLDIRFNQTLDINTSRRYTIAELCGEEAE